MVPVSGVGVIGEEIEPMAHILEAIPMRWTLRFRRVLVPYGRTYGFGFKGEHSPYCRGVLLPESMAPGVDAAIPTFQF